MWFYMFFEAFLYSDMAFGAVFHSSFPQTGMACCDWSGFGGGRMFYSGTPSERSEWVEP